jgi:hypothetical protein
MLQPPPPVMYSVWSVNQSQDQLVGLGIRCWIWRKASKASLGTESLRTRSGLRNRSTLRRKLDISYVLKRLKYGLLVLLPWLMCAPGAARGPQRVPGSSRLWPPPPAVRPFRGYESPCRSPCRSYSGHHLPTLQPRFPLLAVRSRTHALAPCHSRTNHSGQ